MKKKMGAESARRRELAEIVGECIETLCYQQAALLLDNSESPARKPDSAELLKLVSLLEKYRSLLPEPEQEAGKEQAFDEQMIRDYLNRKYHDCT